MRPHCLAIRAVVSGILVLLAAAALATAQEPGVDTAAPRFAVSLVDDGLAFMPAALSVELGDWVRWKSVATMSTLHTSTSGTGCLTGGTLWDFALNPGTQFTRKFTEGPSPFPIPYFCRFHCRFGMKGSVLVTNAIVVAAADNQGSLNLQWQGGSGVYRVFRSDVPAFCSLSPAYPACAVSTTQTFAPDLGDNDTSFTDTTQPDPGKVSYYLIMNKF